MEREEARVMHLLLRPAEFEEVVRCLDDEHQSTTSMGTIKTTKPVGTVNSERLRVKRKNIFKKSTDFR